MCTCGIFRTNSLVHTDYMEEKVNVLKIHMSFELPYWEDRVAGQFGEFWKSSYFSIIRSFGKSVFLHSLTKFNFYNSGHHSRSFCSACTFKVTNSFLPKSLQLKKENTENSTQSHSTRKNSSVTSRHPDNSVKANRLGTCSVSYFNSFSERFISLLSCLNWQWRRSHFHISVQQQWLNK